MTLPGMLPVKCHGNSRKGVLTLYQQPTEAIGKLPGFRWLV
jgi:hypothetical protein